MIADLTTEQQQLAKLISDISERCYGANWMQHVEYILWESLSKGERLYGHDRITMQDINALKDLSNRCNSWILFDNQKEETAVDLPNWQQQFQNEVQLKPGILGVSGI